MKWILMSLATLVIGIFVLTACQGKVTSTNPLKVGDCYNFIGTPPESGGSLVDVSNQKIEYVSCDDPHESEVYAIFESTYFRWDPERLSSKADIRCTARFKAFVGIEFSSSTLLIDSIFPSEVAWKDYGDRRISCSVTEKSGKVSGSAQGSKR